ncbi:MAG TPA: hypothetical protein PK490_22850 [Prosthecobacter sp.]|nr:hypothetical protein [Prosthecobacter sp.]
MSLEDTSSPTIVGRLVSGIAFVAVVCGIFAVREFSQKVASFTKDTSQDSPVGTAIFLAVTLGPALIALFAPRRTIVMVAGLFMIPYVLFAIIYLLIPPIGIALLLPPILWYRSVMRPILTQPLYP